MDESVLFAIIVIVFITVILPCAVCYALVRFLPKLRYLPSILLLLVGLFLLVPAMNTEPSGGGISGFDDLGLFVEMLMGVVFLFAGGVVFVISWLMYRWRLRRQRE